MKVFTFLFFISFQVQASELCRYECSNYGEARFGAKFSSSINSMGDIIYRTWNRKCEVIDHRDKVFWRNTVSGREIEKVRFDKSSKKYHRKQAKLNRIRKKLTHKRIRKVNKQNRRLQKYLRACLKESN